MAVLTDANCHKVIISLTLKIFLDDKEPEIFRVVNIKKFCENNEDSLENIKKQIRCLSVTL